MLFLLSYIAVEELETYLSRLPLSIKNQIQIVLNKEELSLENPYFAIYEDRIELPIQWFNQIPPVFLGQTFPLNPANICATICALQFEFQTAEKFISSENPLYQWVKMCYCFSENFSLANHSFSEDLFGHWYQALAYHYGLVLADDGAILAQKHYEKVINTTIDDEVYAFCIKQYCVFLHDMQAYDTSIMLLLKALEKDISKEAYISLLNEWYAIDLAFSNEDTGFKQIKEIENKIVKCVEFYQNNELKQQLAFTLMDAAMVAQIQKNYSEGLAHLNKSSELFVACNHSSLVLMVHLQKGKLLLHWAQSGQVQFYREALKEFQTALKGYSKTDFPDIYAEIHHQLGIIYAEIPDELSKRAIWTGLSLAAFEEALLFYRQENAPYEYASICNHQGNAYLKYPKTEKTDHYLKALQWYQKALEIRNAHDLPQERALTLLNALEALDSVFYMDEIKTYEKYQQIEAMANEVQLLTEDKNLKELAQQYLDKIALIRQ